jgi:hypothetical protein
MNTLTKRVEPFGEPIDVLEHLSSQIRNSSDFQNTQIARVMVWLADRLDELNPLYEALYQYENTTGSPDDDVLEIYSEITKRVS